MTLRVEPVSGAYQSGESIAAWNGILFASLAAETAAPRFTRPQPKCASQPGPAGSGVPTPPVFPCVTSSAVCSRISRTSSGLSVKPAPRPALTTSPAAPEARPVLIEPVAPSIEIELLRPNCVGLAPRKNVPGGAFVPRPWLWRQ